MSARLWDAIFGELKIKPSAFGIAATSRSVILRWCVVMIGEHGRDNHFWLPPVQTRTGAY
jgi:hypothetical protein